jgi:hypothetical protein
LEAACASTSKSLLSSLQAFNSPAAATGKFAATVSSRQFAAHEQMNSLQQNICK